MSHDPATRAAVTITASRSEPAPAFSSEDGDDEEVFGSTATPSSDDDDDEDVGEPDEIPECLARVDRRIEARRAIPCNRLYESDEEADARAELAEDEEDDDDDVTPARPSSKRKAEPREAKKKKNTEIVMPLDPKQPHFPEELRRRSLYFARRAMRRATSDLLTFVHNIVNIKVAASFNNPAFAAFSKPFEPDLWTMRRENVTLLADFKGGKPEREANTQTLFGDAFVPAEELSSDGKFDFMDDEYPTARHMYFTVETVATLLEYTSNHKPIADVVLGDQQIKLEMTDLGHAALLACDYIRWDRSRATRLDVSYSGERYPNCNNYAQSQTAGHIKVTYTTLPSQYVIPITVEELLEGKTAVQNRLRSLVGSNRAVLLDHNSPKKISKKEVKDSALLSIGGVWIEGIHYNTHRREEIEHLIYASPKTLREVTAKIYFQETADAAIRTEEEEDDCEYFSELIFHDISRHPDRIGINPFAWSMMDQPVEGVMLDDLLLSFDSVSAHELILLRERETRPTPEQIRDAAIEAAIQERKEDYDAAVCNARDARARLIEAERIVVEAREGLSVLRNRMTELLDALFKAFAGMDILEKVTLTPMLSFLLETKDVYARSNKDDRSLALDDDGERPAVYVGKYQIVFSPITSAMHVRNIAAPMAVTADRNDEGKSFSTAFAVFHPHSSSDTDSTSVCLGGYRSNVGKSLRGLTTSRTDLVLDQIRSALLFLQTYSPTDPYVTSLLYVMPEQRPADEHLGITDWQSFCDSSTVDLTGLDFGDGPKGYQRRTIHKMEHKEYEWPVFMRGHDKPLVEDLYVIRHPGERPENINMALLRPASEASIERDAEYQRKLEEEEAARKKRTGVKKAFAAARAAPLPMEGLRYRGGTGRYIAYVEDTTPDVEEDDEDDYEEEDEE